MKMIRSVSMWLLAAALVFGAPSKAVSRVMMTGTVNQFIFSVMPTANFTVDDWLSNPNLWSITVTNSGEGKAVTKLDMKYTIWSSQFPLIAEGTIHVVRSNNSLKTQLAPGETFMVTNTMAQEGKNYVSSGEWSDEFVDEVLRVGYLPEGRYTFRFVLSGNYSDGLPITGSSDLLEEVAEIEIRNPTPPELMTPDDGSDNVVAVPRFTWQRPMLNNFSALGVVQVFYTIRLWRMYDDAGSTITEEEAISRMPIWEVSGLPAEAVDFNPGDSREELISGRRYCWQVQAFDSRGRYITETNQGKSDLWDFTVQFTPPELDEPYLFSPLTLTWSAARASGTPVLYRVRLADNPDFSGGYVERNLIVNRFTYPVDATPLRNGVTYYAEVQATDEAQIPLGIPTNITFQMPTLTARLTAPLDDEKLPGRIPVFTWTGNSQYYVLTIIDEGSDWLFTSSGIADTRYVYDGDPLRSGATYIWTVTPANQFGDAIGEPSSSRRFKLPAANQLSLVSPVNEGLTTVLPVFTWTAPTAVADGAEYTITVYNQVGTPVYSGTSRTTRYEYPRDAPMLGYATRYTWSVTVAAGAQPSNQGWFLTPFIATEGQVVTMSDIGRALLMVMGDFPEYSEFRNLVLTGIRDESGPITPAQLMEIMNDYRLIEVDVK
jgi:hypothetical protein